MTLRALLTVTLLSVAAPAYAEPLVVKLPAKQIKFFAVVYRAKKGVVGEVRLNDMPLATFTGDGTSGSSNQAQGWLMAGTNHLDITTTKVPAGEDDPIKLSLNGLVAEGFPDDDNALFDVAVKKTGTSSYTFELPAAQAPHVLLWTKAAVLTSVSDADKKEIAELAAADLAALQKGDVATLKKLWAFTLEERARATGSDPKQQLDMLDKMAPEMKKSFAKAKLATALEYKLIGGGRIVQVTQKGGKSPVVVKEKDGDTELPISAVKIDGHWTLAP